MRRLAAAAVGSLVFLLLAPGIVAGLVPWWLTDWQVRLVEPWWLPVRVVGVALMAAGLFVLILSFGRFVIEGVGTPAPVVPTEQLVVGGFYRHVRNPMYIAVVVLIAGQALVLGQLGLLLYAAVVFLASATFVHFYEELTLTQRFGEQYEAYRSAVPAWWPRLRPWESGDVDTR